MKKLLLLVAACLSGFANADAVTPFKEGVYNLSGSISYSSEDDSRFGNSTTFYASPGVLYFISPKIAVGGRVNYWRISDDTSRYESYGIAPAFRYYFTQNDLNPFVELSYEFGTSKNASSSGRDYRKNAGIVFGLNYFLAKNVALVPSVSYRHYKYEFNDSSRDAHEQKTLSIGVGVSVFIY